MTKCKDNLKTVLTNMKDLKFASDDEVQEMT